MKSGVYNERIPEAEVGCMFYDRWSPRSFLPEPVPEHQLLSLFEAARWAPSCFNEQPWLFLYATGTVDRKRFASLLVEKNREWASAAPVLMFVIARRCFSATGKVNRYALFDAGAAWVSLAFQARRLGLYAHAMGGFDREKAFAVLDVPKDKYEIIAAVALGRKGPASQLSPDIEEVEKPNTRKSLSEVYIEGNFRGTG